MEPHSYYEQPFGNEYARHSYSSPAYQQSKLRPQSSRGVLIVGGILQFVLILIPFMFIVAMRADFVLAAIINCLCINVFFFILTFILSPIFARNRRILYISGSFFLMAALSILSYPAVRSGGYGINALLIFWLSSIIIAGIFHSLFKRIPPITI